MERRYHNPYRHWLGGLLTEIAVFAAALVVLAAGALLAGYMVR